MTILRSIFYSLAIWRMAPAGLKPYIVGFVFGIPALIVIAALIATGAWLPVLIVAAVWYFGFHRRSAAHRA